jgi:hypothetical protein
LSGLKMIKYFQFVAYLQTFLDLIEVNFYSNLRILQKINPHHFYHLRYLYGQYVILNH